MAVGATACLVLGVTLTGTTSQYSAVTAAGDVATAASNSFGFTHTDGVAGDRVPVTACGTAIAIAGGAIALGAHVEVGSGGKVVTKDAGVAIGIALNATSADGDLVEVHIIPN